MEEANIQIQGEQNVIVFSEYFCFLDYEHNCFHAKEKSITVELSLYEPQLKKMKKESVSCEYKALVLKNNIRHT